VTTTPRQAETTSRVVGAVVTGIFSLLAVWLGWYLTHQSEQTSNPPNAQSALGLTTQAPAVEGALPIRFDPVSEPVPRCSTLAGDGDIPEGEKLWIVVQTNEAGQTKYYFNETYPAAGRWSAPNVVVGSVDTPAGVLFPVLAVTFSDATSSDISTGRYQDGVTELFPDASVHTQITVKSSADRTSC
jgi:hypothetical protein